MISTILLNAKAKDVMSKHLITVTPMTSIKEVDKLFNIHTFHHLPVVSKGGQFKGMISYSDVQLLKHWGTNKNLNASIEENEKVLSSQFAKDIMKKDIVTIDTEASLEYCALAFKENQFHALPVVENNRIIGIITTYDLINVAYL